jgi:dipeptidyl-peptidase-4
LQVGVDGSRVAFLRSNSGRDPVTCLWVLHVADGSEQLVADPRALGTEADTALPPEERARRERAREQASGITSYGIDDACATAAFAIGGRLGVADLVTGSAQVLPTEDAVANPHPSPDGRQIAFASAGRLVVTDRLGAVAHVIAGPPGTTCGLPEFIAAEEMGRMRGFWWSPDSTTLLAAVVDETPVQTWYVADPANPERPPASLRYPSAGGHNADVSLLLAPVGGEPLPVTGWDTAEFPYLIAVEWTAAGLLLAVLSRDQRRSRLLTVDPSTAVARVAAEQSGEPWLEVIDGLPRLLPDGRLLTAVDDAASDTRRLAVDGRPLSPPGLHLAAVRHVGDGAALVVATGSDPTVRDLYLVPLDGGATRQLTQEPGVHDGLAGGDVLVTISATMDRPGSSVVVRRRGKSVATLSSNAEDPGLVPQVRIVSGGERGLRVALLLPRDHVRGRRLPVLMDPYGGPHHAEVITAHNMWLEPQWIANQGFAVVVADGRGTPGRGLTWERAIAGDLASAPLQDQVDALTVAAEHEPDLDTGRVAIRGWSFGGYLAALAVLRRPDIFHAAIAGAPVVDWQLYDTGYTERYLGTDPLGADAAAYAGSSLLADAPKLSRPLLLIHGLADDNVVAAHTLRLSAALLAHGRAHDVLPITGATHMAGAAEVAANLLTLQIGWLRRALRPDDADGRAVS